MAQVGGYDGCMTKKAWKSIYDDLGGNPQNTSAATCTRRHYEKYVKIPAPPQNRKRKLVLAAVLLFMSIIVVRFHGFFFPFLNVSPFQVVIIMLKLNFQFLVPPKNVFNKIGDQSQF